ncbi:HNH endonuclease [Streptomyces sp. NBC_00439]|uniref:HNH endonuclease n=1 Tax=unclassified Streptomyces TaxID=2593676 RepID=UPI002251037A|nr:HNH endonuclease [Streptomyces sp. NBC_00439]MCX5100943.1 HNH endonuclease [Streptomyces sp. NBC_00439]WSX01700.1 HNH endonuclease [Streptomyces sp. NBC_00987]
MPRSPAWTHDELLLACALVVENDWNELREGDPRVLDLSELLRSLPIHEGAARTIPKFRSTGSVSRKTSDLASNHPAYAGTPTKGGRLDKEVIAAFATRPTEMLAAAAALRQGIGTGELHKIPEDPDELDDEGNSAIEGRLLARWALHRERDRSLRARKIARAEKLGMPLQCEVCAFDFCHFYGPLGKGYIEVHHRLPLHVSGPRETHLDDLAFLCANCHRMCHKSRSGKSWRTPSALRAEIAQLTP